MSIRKELEDFIYETSSGYRFKHFGEYKKLNWIDEVFYDIYLTINIYQDRNYIDVLEISEKIYYLYKLDDENLIDDILRNHFKKEYRKEKLEKLKDIL